MSKILLLLVVVGLALSGSVVYADWTATTMEAVGTTDTLVLTPSWTLEGANYAYSYELYNPTANHYVTGFTLGFSTDVPISEFTSFVTPTGWTEYPRTVSNKINWRLGADESFSIAPGQTMTFGFTSKLGPAVTQSVLASSQDTYGFSGQTFGPAVPEPGSLMTLGMGLVGLVSLKLKRR